MSSRTGCVVFLDCLVLLRLSNKRATVEAEGLLVLLFSMSGCEVKYSGLQIHCLIRSLEAEGSCKLAMIMHESTYQFVTILSCRTPDMSRGEGQPGRDQPTCPVGDTSLLFPQAQPSCQ